MKKRPAWILPIIIFSQFTGTSLWFAGNAIIADIQRQWSLGESTLGYMTSIVQLGFIAGTLCFAVLAVSDRFSPRKVFFFCSLLGAFSNLLVYLAAFSYFDEVKKTGVKFYRYTDGFLHQKAMLVDDVSASVGTANFDNRSFRLNFEITATIADSAFVSDVERMFEADFARSRQMEPGELDEKSFWFKLGVKIARLTSPIQ